MGIGDWGLGIGDWGLSLSEPMLCLLYILLFVNWWIDKQNAPSAICL